MDRRFQAYNERVAAFDLKSSINHHNFVQPQQYQIAVPLCDLQDRPNEKDSDNCCMVQLLMCLRMSKAGPLFDNNLMGMLVT